MNDCLEAQMGAAGPLQLMLLVVVAGAAALCGFVASAVILRGRRRARGYFVLGVLTGLMAGTIRRGRFRKPTSLAVYFLKRRGLWSQ